MTSAKKKALRGQNPQSPAKAQAKNKKAAKKQNTNPGKPVKKPVKKPGGKAARVIAKKPSKSAQRKARKRQQQELKQPTPRGARFSQISESLPNPPESDVAGHESVAEASRKVADDGLSGPEPLFHNIDSPLQSAQATDRLNATRLALQQLLLILKKQLESTSAPNPFLDKELEKQRHVAEVNHEYCRYYPSSIPFEPPPGPRRVPGPDDQQPRPHLSPYQEGRQRLWETVEYYHLYKNLEGLRSLTQLQTPLHRFGGQNPPAQAYLKPAPPEESKPELEVLYEASNSSPEAALDSVESMDRMVFNVDRAPGQTSPEDVSAPYNVQITNNVPSAGSNSTHGPPDSNDNDDARKTSMTSDQSAEGDAMQAYADANGKAVFTQRSTTISSKSAEHHGKHRKLAELSPTELDVQLKYFHTTRSKDVDLTLPSKCLSCASVDHEAPSCPTLSCEVCSADKRHVTELCPQRLRCVQCLQKGHMKPDCPFKLKASSVDEVVCDLCACNGHVEEDCEVIWRTSGRPWDCDLVSLKVRFYCYECGHFGHLGNDCSSRMPRKPLASSSWTTQRKYGVLSRPSRAPPPARIEHPRIPSQAMRRPDADGLQIRGRADSHDRFHYREDLSGPAPFLPAKPPSSRQNGQIQIKGLGSSRIADKQAPPVNPMGGSYHERYDKWDNRLPPEPPRERYYAEARGSGFRPRSRSPSPYYDNPERVYRDRPLPYGEGQPRKNGYQPMPSAASKAWSRYRT